MELVKFPHKALFTKCKDVNVFDDNLKVILEAMWEIMKDHNGLGLSSNQVALNYRMFVMLGPKEEKLFIVNPKILKKSLQMLSIPEGCLSASGEFLVIRDRSEWVQVEFRDHTGTLHTRVFKDVQALCFQHELEHLEGNSFLESKTIPKKKRKELAIKWNLHLR